jgi:glutamate racemase
VTRLLVFDSGIGGLSVARSIRELLPAAELIYVADDVAFPYGAWEEAALADHVVGLVGDLIGRFGPDAVVIACNTASTLVLPRLRADHRIPFVGTVPAIKPAAERTQSGLISVLATVGTIRRDYTRALITRFAGHCRVQLVGSDSLAALAESHMRGEPTDDRAIAAEIEPAFVDDAGGRTDVVVLACTHYPFLQAHLAQSAPWPVAWIDPAPAIARRVAEVVGPGKGGPGGGSAHATSSRRWPPPLADLLRGMGLAD